MENITLPFQLINNHWHFSSTTKSWWYKPEPFTFLTTESVRSFPNETCLNPAWTCRPLPKTCGKQGIPSTVRSVHHAVHEHVGPDSPYQLENCCFRPVRKVLSAVRTIYGQEIVGLDSETEKVDVGDVEPRGPTGPKGQVPDEGRSLEPVEDAKVDDVDLGRARQMGCEELIRGEVRDSSKREKDAMDV
ncbi:stromal cell-derived factor 2-like protein [Striga asiatica]|uniref:Stromal cell-derived factor 2-like protein n=1 Tax=Striga asiatica TaxID=4170 RepID=A0A5A7QF01_STRAF|nr:stromal cell-derived factor 2-like protein [Striga asiatica]